MNDTYWGRVTFEPISTVMAEAPDDLEAFWELQERMWDWLVEPEPRQAVTWQQRLRRVFAWVLRK